MALSCPDCSRPYAPDDVDLHTALARCRPCGRVHRLDRQPMERPDLPCPSAVSVEREGRGLRMRVRWFQWHAIFLLFFCVAWDAFLVNWYGIALSTNGPLIMVIFPIAHVAVGVGLTYYTASLLLNRTTVEVGRGRLVASHGPLPWTGGCDLPTASIRQLYVVERVGNKGARSWQLLALADGLAIEVTTRHSDIDVPRFLERRIEAYLGIEDARVDGEASTG